MTLTTTLLREKLAEFTQRIVHNPVLDAIEAAKLSTQDWKVFAEQRYLAARLFESLLEEGIQKSRDYPMIRDVLEDNLRDERGVDREGRKLPLGSHEQWRKDFYRALGVTDEMLAQAQPLDGTRRYDETLRGLIDSEPMVIAGALLLLEYSIPVEFERIRKGRDATFRETFVVLPSDDADVRTRKRQAARYINDHIAHDAASHYPDLENAVVGYADTRVLRGMAKIARGREEFYGSLGNALNITSS